MRRSGGAVLRAVPPPVPRRRLAEDSEVPPRPQLASRDECAVIRVRFSAVPLSFDEENAEMYIVLA